MLPDCAAALRLVPVPFWTPPHLEHEPASNLESEPAQSLALILASAVLSLVLV